MTDVREVVTATVREILPDVGVDEIRPDRHLRDLGADSVDRVEIIGAVLDRLSLDEPLSSFSDLPDIEAMVDLLERLRATA
ncbi:polyketide biosynthesis acyl carrier protein [Jatrophihabitans endophyticus]|uniref:Polyketide biosynthesis acyl carrier protein n=1 Tax=Jatrophihabitans endophyticus TaxID=1206085 RepID=A0A1M5I5Q3_9ACTN|nr:phosphopantetheine-binding protein [Jatrophihabitans endophyticus]SHG23668.1 polyketide biosynthesis acyl carrier protein [Jatrophihabitans endophyticus]